MKISVKTITTAGIIAALYVVLTWLTSLFGLASGVIQVRISEALCVLPIFTPAAIPGLFIGCIIANSITGSVLIDIIFGSIATLIGAIGTRFLRKKPILALLPPIVANMIIVPIVLIKAYAVEDALWFLILTVGAGEIISVGILGFLLYTLIKQRNLEKVLF
ncbi:MAG: QueT transporter family protein [Lachnospiraceae bacterium]|nr:QueT transporter family protein [Lachnospiraceae bacterium]